MKAILLVIGLTLALNNLLSQSIQIGSGLDADTLLVKNFNDTIFSGIVTSRDAVDIFTSIPVERGRSKFSFYING